MALKQLGAAPSGATDVAPKSYVDPRSVPAGGTAGQFVTKNSATDYDQSWSTIVLPSVWPKSGDWASPYNLGGSSASAPTSGAADFEPFIVPPGAPRSIQAIGVNVTTALVVGSATVVCKVALYPSDVNGQPVLTNRLEYGDLTITTTGNKSITVTRSLAPGLYWGAFLYAVTSGTPTTGAAFLAINSAFGLPVPSGLSIGTAVRSFRLTGLTDLPTTAQTLTVNGGSTAACVGLRAA